MSDVGGVTRYKTVDEIRSAATGYFFSYGAMSFFDSRILEGVYHGVYFITSEQFDWSSERRYTIRQITPDGHIVTVGDFQQYGSFEAARDAAQQLTEESR